MKFVLMTDEIFASAEKEWGEYLGDESREHFAEQYNVLLDAVQFWLIEGKDDTQEDKKYFAVYDQENNSCLAIINVTHVLPTHPTKSYFKSLAFRTHPRFDSRNDFENADEIQRYGDMLVVLQEFVFGVIQLLIKREYNIKSFKIYGNYQMDTGFFYSMMMSLKRKTSYSKQVTWQFFKFAHYNKWLEITLT